jgi:predicted glycoside hydrolase/deacetylase ChbG (UPF0249 family)
MKKLIVNADDLGYAQGVNEGIIRAHKEGIVTSTSLMVKGADVLGGIELAMENPKLGLGLHFQIANDDWILLRQLKKAVAITLVEKTKQEFIYQVETFCKLTGKMPDHIDSHHHVHRLPRIYSFISSFCQKNHIPMRGQTNFIDSFFGMPTTKPLNLDNLVKILNGLPDGISELMCHPGVVSPDLKSTYSHEREIELQVLTSPKVKSEINKLKILLINWKDFII